MPFAIPEVIRHANAFVLGAQATRPSAKVRLVWTNSWFDPKKERQAAESLVAAGADVLGQNVDSPSAGQYAESKKIPWVGYNSDARKFAPTSWLTAALYDWGVYYVPRVKAAMNGTWKTGFYYGTMKDGFIKLAPYGKRVSAKTRAPNQCEAEGDHLGLVQPVYWPALRPGGEAPRPEGQDADDQGALRDELAREGHDRQREGLAPPLERQTKRGGAGLAGASRVPAVSMRGITKRSPASSPTSASTSRPRPGEVHALLGENGAGKTTLMNVLTGLYRPDEGEISLYGEPVHFDAPRDALAAGIGMVHQHFRLVEPLTVAENLMLGWHTPRFWLGAKEGRRQVREVSEALQMSVDPDARIWQLSVGEQQRVEIVKAVFRGSRILVLDEPTAVLTPQEAEQLFDTLRLMAREGHSVIVITHKLHEVMAVADRITVLRGGRSVATVAVSEVTQRSLAALMVGREIAEARRVEAQHSIGDAVLEVEGLSAVGDRGGLARERRLSRRPRRRDRGRRGCRRQRPARAGGDDLRHPALQRGRGTRRRAQRSAVATPARRSRPAIAHVPEDRLGTGLAPGLSIASNVVAQDATATRAVSRGPILLVRRMRELALALIRRYDVKAPGTGHARAQPVRRQPAEARARAGVRGRRRACSSRRSRRADSTSARSRPSTGTCATRPRTASRCS